MAKVKFENLWENLLIFVQIYVLSNCTAFIFEAFSSLIFILNMLYLYMHGEKSGSTHVCKENVFWLCKVPGEVARVDVEIEINL